VPGYEVLTWYGLFLPNATPPAVAKQLHSAVVASVNSQDIQEKTTALGAEARSSSPGEFAAMVRAAIAKWGKVVHSAGIRPE
jgi:tripartite-type tricarboxylate transporter receptor subunit TctC